MHLQMFEIILSNFLMDILVLRYKENVVSSWVAKGIIRLLRSICRGMGMKAVQKLQSNIFS